MSCVPNVASVSGLAILDYTFGFSNVYLLPTVCPVTCVPNVARVSGLAIVDYTPSVSLTFIYYQHSVLCLVYIMFPVSLDWTFLIASLVFSNV